MARLRFPHVDFTPRGESHATFSVDRDRQIVAELRQLLEQKRVLPKYDEYPREQTLEKFEVEHQEIEREREKIKTRVEDLKMYHQNLDSEQETLVQAQGGLCCKNEQYRAEFPAKFDPEQQKLEQVARDLRSDRHEFESDMLNVMEGQNERERERERKWLQEERLEFGRAQRQAQLDLKESHQKLKQERERLREDRLRFEEVRNILAHANLQHGQSLDKRSEQLDEDRLEIVRKRRELDQGLLELIEEGGWSVIWG